jgi:AraC-like DNA-binding protein
MNIHFTVISFLSIFFIIAGATISLVLWNFPRANNISNKMLSVTLICLIWTIFIGFLAETQLISHVPHLYRTGHITILIFIPLTYIYVRYKVRGKGLTVSDLIHTLPLLLYLIDYFPFFGLSSTEKLALLYEDLHGYHKMNDFDEGWFIPAGFHFFIRRFLFLFYWILQVRILYLLHFRKSFSRTHVSRISKTWLYNFTGLQVCGFFPLLIRLETSEGQWLVATIALGFPILFSTIWLFLKPEILYGLDLQKNKGVDVPKDVIPLQNGAPHLQSIYLQEFSDTLHKHMIENKKFLQHKYTIIQLSADVSIPPHQISHFVNKYLNTSFSHFLNKYRIEHCIERIKAGDAQRFTLEALSFNSGFSNRNSFTMAFKRFTGVTPSDFMRHFRSAGHP